MISDTLHDAVSEIDGYLDDDAAGMYGAPDLRLWIVSVRNSMEALRCVLDTLPDGTMPTPRPFPPEREA